MKKTILLITALCMIAVLAACGGAGTNSGSSKTEVPTPSGSASAKTAGIDYMALVNKLHELPKGWEEALETIHFTNSVGDDVEVEKKAYDAYLRLKEDLEKDGIYVDLDSARRSVADQQRIMDDFIEKYGKDYAFKTVAQPGYSEHHTGLALDLYLIVGGKDITENEDMVEYPQIWDKIHEKLAEYGFILRYLEGKEHQTGYGYEPWHIRYLDDVDVAKEIMEKGITFEEFLGEVEPSDVNIDYGESGLFTKEQLEEAVVQIKCKFATFEGCELQNIRYAGDANNTEENIKRMNEIAGGDQNYVECAEFLMDFHSPKEGNETLEPDREYKDYQWRLARKADGGLEIVTYGYGG